MSRFSPEEFYQELIHDTTDVLYASRKLGPNEQKLRLSAPAKVLG